MAGLLKTQVQLGDSATATQNFVLTSAAADGTMKLARGNYGATTQDIITVDSSGLVTFTQGKQLTLGTIWTSTSGTSHDWAIPSWAKRITVVMNSIRLSGAALPRIQIGTGGVPTTTGYTGTYGYSAVSASNAFAFSGGGFDIYHPATAISGTLVLTHIGGNMWIASGSYATTVSTYICVTGGSSPTIAGVVDTLRVTSTNGTDTYNLGSINVMYEG